jgi:hypothetical protein
VSFILEEYMRDRIADLAADNQRLREALEQIAGWQSHTLPFAVDFGSNGVRDFYRNIARDALSTNGEVKE